MRMHSGCSVGRLFVDKLRAQEIIQRLGVSDLEGDVGYGRPLIWADVESIRVWLRLRSHHRGRARNMQL